MTDLLPLGDLGAIEANGSVTFGLWLPWVSAANGNRITVKVIHEHDQFLQAVPPREFPMTHSLRPPHGDFWSVAVPIAGTPPAARGRHGERRGGICFATKSIIRTLGSSIGSSIRCP